MKLPYKVFYRITDDWLRVPDSAAEKDVTVEQAAVEMRLYPGSLRAGFGATMLGIV